jgi:hypothetical protein
VSDDETLGQFVVLLAMPLSTSQLPSALTHHRVKRDDPAKAERCRQTTMGGSKIGVN